MTIIAITANRGAKGNTKKEIKTEIILTLSV
jgi:hypothetical protein